MTETESEPYNGTEREILGTYDSKALANQSAKTFARSRHADYWDHDGDEMGYTKETEDVNGCLSIRARDPEGSSVVAEAKGKGVA
ncbi:hypothetical protein GLAREA_06496 [Glarea lozoyensis ATCC 20868]|uniref:Uncharacterized protein n=1 Tax=Glarea lozoyensis (strain ATCC 20868 / MF5171) TaxID=1116229 RepID=S3E4Z1_GLAL2|nr:uncharacterized protein GLAREA_06496 [Glarea lozoyensis ATCC 20868]EPE33483.1 hypothetical protein GLAREA_06496 [Glarea lozoyensis ATCC 20868]